MDEQGKVISSTLPQVIISSFHHPKTGDLYVRMVPLRPGMIIERNGKRYQVDAKGTQRRVK